jgi:hypothetical protein
MAKLEEFFSHEPASIQAEFADLNTKLQKASSPFGEMPTLPAFSQDLQDAQARIHERLKDEEFQNGDEFDQERYFARISELFKEEPPHIQAELDALKPQLEALSQFPLRVTRQRKRTLKRIRKILQDEPVVVYRTGIEWEGIPPNDDTIVVAPTTDQFDILRYERTDGANYGLQTEDVIEKLKEVNAKYGIDIVGAGIGGVEFILKRIPKGKEAQDFGQWLLDFCPDLYEAPLSFPKGKVALWWD